MTKTKEKKLPNQITVRQIHGKAGRTQDIYDTLSALGLGRIGKERTFKNPSAPLMGMIKKVSYLLKVTEA